MKNILIALFLALISPTHLLAGSSEAGRPILPKAQVQKFADRVQNDLAKRGAHVAIVARMGRDPSQLPDGIHYTHVAFWVYSRITNADGTTGTGYRVYNLYQRADNSSRSDLVQDSPADFFAGAKRFDAGIIIPDPRLQQKLLNIIAGPAYQSLHNPHYSVLSNPNTSQFQNCTEHTMDVMMAALYGTTNKKQIKANMAAYFTPQPIAISETKRTLAGIASRGLTTADHGKTVATATFEAIARFMQANKLAAKVYSIKGI